MINHNKKWLLYDDKNKIFFEKSFENVFNDSVWQWFDFFYKEIYAFEFSKTNCIYEMSDCIINKDDVVVDLGANVGFFTNYASHKCKKVISVEGGDAFFSCLVKNTYENNNIEYLNANIVSESCKNITTWANPTKINITLSDIFDLYKLDKIDFLKIDIENNEYDVFKDIDKSILSKIKKIAVEVHDINRNKQLIDNINQVSKNFFCFDWCVGSTVQTTFYFF
jgi:23S rRNA U2552 (ribose-2'-O)-methylase RlmE/FtsJ